MQKQIEVGCIVEVVRAMYFRDWEGRQLVVTGFQHQPHTREHPDGYLGVLTTPSPPDVADGFCFARGWHPNQLRRIDPPDWEAPRIQEQELTT